MHERKFNKIHHKHKKYSIEGGGWSKKPASGFKPKGT